MAEPARRAAAIVAEVRMVANVKKKSEEVVEAEEADGMR